MSSNSHSTTQTNVVALRPKKLSKAKMVHIEESIEQAREVKRDFCEEVVEFVMEQLISNLQAFGTFQDASKVKQKDVILLEQSIQSLVYRYQGIPHPLHNVIETLIQSTEDEEGELDEEPEKE